MALKDFLRRKEPLLAVDIGSTSLKILEFDIINGVPTVVNLGYSEYDGPVFGGFVINKPEKVAETFKRLMEASGMVDRRVALAIPSAGVFSKRIKIPRMAAKDLDANVKFEAARFLPDKLDALKIDFHVLGEVGNSYDILLIAVKNDVVESFMSALMMIGLQTAVMDIEIFSVQNMFEVAHPEMLEQACLLIHVGARGSAMNLVRAGDSLVVDNISVGGKAFTDAIVAATGLDFAQAETLKKSPEQLRSNDLAWAAVTKKMEEMASQISRQLNLIKGAAGLTGPVDRILLAGGGARLPEFSRIIKEHTGVDTQYLAVSRGLQISDNIDRTYLEQMEPYLAVAGGLTLRQPGDKNII
jgi:type IV pilus assembly protein PilM